MGRETRVRRSRDGQGDRASRGSLRTLHSPTSAARVPGARSDRADPPWPATARRFTGRADATAAPARLGGTEKPAQLVGREVPDAEESSLAGRTALSRKAKMAQPIFDVVEFVIVVE